MASKKKNFENNPYILIQLQIAKVINSALKELGAKTLIGTDFLEIPPDSKMGDLALPCFIYAKELKLAPNLIAQKIAQIINQKVRSECIERVESQGAYINFFVRSQYLAKLVIECISKDKKYGASKRGKGKKLMVEYVSPNTNKPLHLGHLRNAFLGYSIAQLAKKVGFKVVKSCLVNDRGVHICKSMLAYQIDQKDKRAKDSPKSTNTKGDHFVGNYYVLFEKMLKQRPELKEELQSYLVKWESKDKKVRELWQSMNDWVLKGFEETYKRLGVDFDQYYFESKIYKKGKEIIAEGLEKGVFKKDQTGAIYAALEKHGLADKVVLRADGTSIYATQDLYLAVKKQEQYKLNKSIYIIGSEQDLYLKQLFKMLELLGYDWAKSLYHLSYGMVYLPEGKMKSREGTVIDADNLMDKLQSLVVDQLKTRGEILDVEQMESRADVIALAALKFYFLEVSPKSDIHFNPAESISFQGRTGPYLQYSYARIKSILHKSAKDKKVNLKNDYDWQHEKKILFMLSQYPFIIEQAAFSYDPSLVARYLYQLAQDFSEYYHQVEILKAEPTQRASRLQLLVCLEKVLKQGLEILGIKVLERM